MDESGQRVGGLTAAHLRRDEVGENPHAPGLAGGAVDVAAGVLADLMPEPPIVDCTAAARPLHRYGPDVHAGVRALFLCWMAAGEMTARHDHSAPTTARAG